MAMKERDIPWALFKLEALEKRLIPSHDAKELLEIDFRKKRRQIRGEKRVEFPLSFLDEDKFEVLHNVRVEDEQGFFQIDTLVLSRKFGLILEIKNWYGMIIFGENGQVTRIGDDKKEEGFPNPIPQAKLQQYRLQKWLRKQGYPTLPIAYLIVISFPSTVIRPHPPATIPQEVIHNSQLTFSIRELENTYTNQYLSKKQLIKLLRTIMDAHTPEPILTLRKYNVHLNELVRGVFCPSCKRTIMQWRRQKWFCSGCYHISTDAHLSALNEYKLLINDYITNKEAIEFLRIDSPNVVKNILQKLQLQSTGNTKSRKYELEFYHTHLSKY
ncbi:NERD domain-containing protein [Ornithinibacillus sp. L9]|uniref:NERD domain-containing protein n=1 Tax=Ornithinibacillus caprae TaxID=2678566 RepID=A0A6N8FJJ8_9BACI|nr:nuclease-related domain-containing protein [Ornithinibacillus caprae]MUK89635.1 NERD domain-containing protein [Ornithinibacillus caprae]